VLLVVRVLFKTYLLAWINYPFGLSNASLLGILELRKDTDATILPTWSILYLQMSCSLSLFHTSLHKVQWLHQSWLSFFRCMYCCLHLLMFLMSLHQDTTEPPAPKPLRDFRYVYTHRQKILASKLVLIDSSSPVEGPSPQPLAHP